MDVPLFFVTSHGIILAGDGRTMPEHFDPAVLHAFRAFEDPFAEACEAERWHRIKNKSPTKGDSPEWF